jgi:glycine/D-amino acid oxidase-like deaminating enzyme
LPGDVSADGAVLGGGIVGLTAAVLLKRSGKRVVLIEANRIVEGVTANTTAKLTSQHNLIYDSLIRSHGEKKAWLYAEPAQYALEVIRGFFEERGVKVGDRAELLV